MNQILENIRKIREEKGLSQEFVAEQLGITQSKYARFERGTTKTDLEMLESVASIFDKRLIDVITYPKVFIDKDADENKDFDTRTIVQIEIKNEKKKKFLELLFGDKDLEIIK